MQEQLLYAKLAIRNSKFTVRDFNGGNHRIIGSLMGGGLIESLGSNGGCNTFAADASPLFKDPPVIINDRPLRSSM